MKEELDKSVSTSPEQALRFTSVSRRSGSGCFTTQPSDVFVCFRGLFISVVGSWCAPTQTSNSQYIVKGVKVCIHRPGLYK